MTLIGRVVSSRRVPEERPLLLEASIAYTTLPTATALSSDVFADIKHAHSYFICPVNELAYATFYKRLLKILRKFSNLLKMICLRSQ